MPLISFYATRNDLLDLLNDFESRGEVRYAKAGMFNHDDICVYRTAIEIPGLGKMATTNSIRGNQYLMGNADVQFSMYSVPQRRGGVRYALNQKENPDTVSMLPGGQFDEQTIVAGDFGTCTNSPDSLAMIGLLRKIARKKWCRIKSYLVGPQAEAVLNAGGRLTAGLRPEYDLQR